jgi:hypothetical protein
MRRIVGILGFLLCYALTAFGQNCPGDWNLDGEVTIDEIILAVNSALNGCSGQARTPTRTPTPGPPLQLSPTPTFTSTSPPPQLRLEDFIGTWAFTFTIESVFTLRYQLIAIEVINGVRILKGFSLDDQQPAFMARLNDLDPGSVLPYMFALFHRASDVCILYVFDPAGPNTVSGRVAPALVEADGSCGEAAGLFPFTGVRVGRSAALSQQSSVNPDQAALAKEVSEAPASRPSTAGMEVQKLLSIFNSLPEAR